MKTGFKVLDNMIKLDKARLILVDGYGCTIKPMLSLNIARNVAIRQDKAILYFALENTKREVVNSILSSELGIEKRDIEYNRLTHEQWIRVRDKIGTLIEKQIYIDDNPGISISDIIKKIIKFKEQKNANLIVIDSLNFVVGTQLTYSSREEEINEIIDALKTLAEDLNVTIIINDTAVTKGDTTEITELLGTIKERTLKENTDVIIFLDRNMGGYLGNDTVIVEITVAKNNTNNSSVGTFQLLYQIDQDNFVNINK